MIADASACATSEKLRLYCRSAFSDISMETSSGKYRIQHRQFTAADFGNIIADIICDPLQGQRINIAMQWPCRNTSRAVPSACTCGWKAACGRLLI